MFYAKLTFIVIWKIDFHFGFIIQSFYNNIKCRFNEMISFMINFNF
ncbi:hypothetical protein LX77_01399 [Gelidibacter algens]|uniref:Uncharacterized protein n=1 Tax=Gelidibacter algens TaxID=49280 RepID=A0A327S8J3_9FLAO|nr:hypothetical protein LX77_01399 [Gelidibacter algens]